MAENVRETRPPEPPPKPPEMPKPTERSNRSEAGDRGRPNESQQSAQQDARNAAQPELAKATNGRQMDGLRPTPEFAERSQGSGPPQRSRDSDADRPSEHSDSAPRLQDSQAAQRSQDAGSARPQDSHNAQRSQEATVGGRNAAVPAGEQAGEYAVARQAAVAERAKATEDMGAPGETPRPQSTKDAGESALDPEQPQHQARTIQPPEGSRTDEPVTASPPDESVAARRPVDQNAAADRNGAQQEAGEYQAAAREQARPQAETTGETTPPEETSQPTRRDSRGREIPDEVQRLPSGRLPANWHYAGRVYDGEHWTPDLAERYPDGVQFTNDGFPDFSPYATRTVTFDPQYQGNTTTDFTDANRLATLARTPDDYTWHHHQDTRTMQLVPTEIHDAVRHAGGRAILR